MRNKSCNDHHHLGSSAAHIGDNLPFRVEMIPTSALSLLESIRIYSSEERRYLRRIIKRFGIQQPIVANDQNEVVIGQALFLAAQEVGLPEVPVIRLETIGQLEAQALSVAYARLGELGKPDQARIGEIMLRCEIELGYDISDFGYEVAQVDLMLNMVTDEPEEAPVALEKQAVSVLSDIWEMNRHRLICGDALDGRIYDQLMEGEKAHAAFTDPPYGCGIDGFVAGKGRHREFVMGSGDMSADELCRFFVGFNKAMAAHLGAGAVIYEAIDWRSLHVLLDATRDIWGPLVNLAVWTKDRPGQGSFLRSQHELVLIFKTKGKMRNNVMLGKYGRSRANVWSYPSALTASKGSDEGNILAEHPTPKPVRLVADALLDTTKRGDIVLDPFSGSGTTLIAAEKIGRRARLIELDPLYVDLAVRRWQAWTGGIAIHAETGDTFDERAARVNTPASAAE
ncbi:DNA modification methylase [Rhizorhapis sp.]|uniref:DNA modification methylase n=1 Tax=Rhizorhapis sp. TaxID=1968842 RepID=UPI002B48ABAF|nr:DNA modification methylase [Rhizorhapis sp.]HKR15846.1 DNA modification methylase [Rhizorhapis sp.]